MPDIDFTLPHWLYFIGLIVFPLVAAAMVKRTRAVNDSYSLVIGYMILVFSGIMGLHRFYARNWTGVFFAGLFIAILLVNGVVSEQRNHVSNYSNEVRVASQTVERERERLPQARADLTALEGEVAAAEEGSFAKTSAERRHKRAQARIERSERDLARYQAELERTEPLLLEAEGKRAFWFSVSRYGFYLLLLGLAVDCLLLPRLIARANRLLAEEKARGESHLIEEADAAEAAHHADDQIKADEEYVSSGWTGRIDRLSQVSGEFVSYWAVIAVLVYYFEVVSRYAFNSPTNWAHESMYLMFGMQYLIAGSYALLCEDHVRVDIFYAPLSARRKAILDIVTSLFFFIFAGTLLVTCYIFAFDAITVPAGNSVVSQWARGEIDFTAMLAGMDFATFFDPAIRWGEISFNEWEIPLWPMKWVMVLGGVLLVLQGASKLAQNIAVVARGQ